MTVICFVIMIAGVKEEILIVVIANPAKQGEATLLSVMN